MHLSYGGNLFVLVLKSCALRTAFVHHLRAEGHDAISPVIALSSYGWRVKVRGYRTHDRRIQKCALKLLMNFRTNPIN